MMDKIIRSTSIEAPTIERRMTRGDGEGDEPQLESYGFRGHSIVFDSPTLIGSRAWGFIEVVAPGASRNVLNDDVRFLFNHDGLPLARTTNGTLRLSEDARGQVAEADLSPTGLGADLAIALERQDVSQMSFAFGLGSDDYTWGTYSSEDEWNGMDMRTINTFSRQYDVSAVTYPAYEDTDAGLRMHGASDEEIRTALRAVRPDTELNARFAEDMAHRQRVLQLMSRKGK